MTRLAIACACWTGRLRVISGRWSGWPALRSFFNVTDATVSTIQDIALYWLGAALCLLTLRSASPLGPMTWGDVIQFMLAATLFKRPVGDLTNSIQEWRINKAMLESVRDYESQPVVFPEDEPAAGALPAGAISTSAAWTW